MEDVCYEQEIEDTHPLRTQAKFILFQLNTCCICILVSKGKGNRKAVLANTIILLDSDVFTLHLIADKIIRCIFLNKTPNSNIVNC